MLPPDPLTAAARAPRNLLLDDARTLWGALGAFAVSLVCAGSSLVFVLAQFGATALVETVFRNLTVAEPLSGIGVFAGIVIAMQVSVHGLRRKEPTDEDLDRLRWFRVVALLIAIVTLFELLTLIVAAAVRTNTHWGDDVVVIVASFALIVLCIDVCRVLPRSALQRRVDDAAKRLRLATVRQLRIRQAPQGLGRALRWTAAWFVTIAASSGVAVYTFTETMSGWSTVGQKAAIGIAAQDAMIFAVLLFVVVVAAFVGAWSVIRLGGHLLALPIVPAVTAVTTLVILITGGVAALVSGWPYIEPISLVLIMYPVLGVVAASYAVASVQRRHALLLLAGLVGAAEYQLLEYERTMAMKTVQHVTSTLAKGSVAEVASKA